MRGGVKFYRGSAGAARNYVESGRSRADDYYLVEGTGFAERYSATADGQVRAMPLMDGDAYEAWVSGIDPETGELRGRVRNDEHALRFAEVVVNGPKSWSIAAELHPDVAAAYEAAQDNATREIVRYFAQHATTRVGPRGGQVATPVERLEAVAVQHYTSRAGDPHRHIHVQINARVQAAGKWRGIDSVAVRDAIGAVQGLGHSTVMADPAFRQALAAHGFTLDPGTGEISELTVYAAAFSKRAEQISRQVAGYEAEWRAANPDSEPGPALRRSWDARAWAEHRPGKAHVEPGQVLHERWLDELAALGYQPPAEAVLFVPTSVGQLDRDAAAAEVLARLTASRSAWNQHDVYGEAEQLLARRGVVADPEVRRELAEDLAARAQAASVPLLERPDTPAHIRAWTSAEAVAVEADLTGRLAVRGATTGRDADLDVVERAAAAAGGRLDPCQADAAAALAGDHALVLVTGAAGAGKTTTLAAARAALDEDGHQLVVVTPTLKAARGARAETGAHTGSAAWLVHQHGWRWDDDTGAWTRLQPGDRDPDRKVFGRVYRGPSVDARLSLGDLVVVDEAGMLDQDTARALLVVADEAHARVALVGDPHQLPAIGRGGVLDLAGRWAERATTLDVIHRFTRTAEIEPGVHATVEDLDYAALSLRMRAGAAGDPGAVFDDLAARGQVRCHSTVEDLRNDVAAEAAAAHRAGRPAAVSVATNEAAHALSVAIREQLIATGHVDDGQHGPSGDSEDGTVATSVVTTGAGQRVGASDLIATRSNDQNVDIANRDTWTVTAVHPDGSLTITPTGVTLAAYSIAGTPTARTLPAGYVNQHVELGYATTVHGVQGETADSAHLVLDEHSSAQAAYVGMTRGRSANTVHVLAEDTEQARELWIGAAGRGRPDLGVEAARREAEQAAARYATAGQRDPAVDPPRVAEVLDQLREAWTAQANAATLLERLEPRLAAAQVDAERAAARDARLASVRERVERTRAAAAAAAGPAEHARAQLTERAEAMQGSLRENWDLDRGAAGEAAREVQAGPGRFGRITGGRDAVAANFEFLDQWAAKWRPVVPELTGAEAAVTFAARHPGNDRIDAALHDYVSARVLDQSPDLARDVHRGAQTAQDAAAALTAYTGARRTERLNEARLWAGAGWRQRGEDLPELTTETTAARRDLEHAEQQIDALAGDPAVAGQPNPVGWLAEAHDRWAVDRDQRLAAAAARAAVQADRDATTAAQQRMRQHENDQPSYSHDAGRDGPGFGR